MSRVLRSTSDGGPLGSELPRLRPDSLYGRYRTLGRMKMGNLSELFFGVVTHADGSEASCVIKGPGVGRGIEPSLVSRLLEREGELLSALADPKIVRLRDRFELGPSRALVLEHIQGISVADALQSLRRRHLTLPPRLGLAVFRQLLEALIALHEATDGAGRPLDIRHCDVTPGNLMLTDHGELQVLDFGISQWRGDRPNFSAGLCLGTPGYFAPEQICGGPSTHAADIFAAGVVACRLLGARHSPFARRNLQDCLRATIGSHRAPVHELVGDVPSSVCDLVEEMLAVPARARPPAHQLLDRLEAAVRDVDVASREELAIFTHDFAAHRRDPTGDIAPTDPTRRVPRPVSTTGPFEAYPASSRPAPAPRAQSQTADLPPLASTMPTRDLEDALRHALVEALPESWLDADAPPDEPAPGPPAAPAPSGAAAPEAGPAISTAPPAPPDVSASPASPEEDDLPEVGPEHVISVEADSSEVEAFIDQGVEAILGKDFDRAVAAFETARRADPDNRIVAANLARLAQLGFGADGPRKARA